MREEDEKLLLAILMLLLAAQMRRVLEHPDWGILPDELEAQPVAAVMTGIALREAAKLWAEKTTMPPPASLWTSVTTSIRRYAFDLFKEIDEITRSELGLYLRTYVTEGWTLGELEAQIATIFGPDRANRIAVTEVTRAYSMAKWHTADEMAALGLPMIATWETEHDDLVCDICGPLDGKPEGHGWTRLDEKGNEQPPAHPNCRCSLRLEVA